MRTIKKKKQSWIKMEKKSDIRVLKMNHCPSARVIEQKLHPTTVCTQSQHAPPPTALPPQSGIHSIKTGGGW